ncbi:hypothetical protein [Sphingobium aquiterrae]|uniref:hypothetical protein n=1 Tax=Sphingobium aquiterrae TaxID=2038656 RepID=UPI003018EB8C
MRHFDPNQCTETKPPFGLWLLAQIKRDDEIGMLARCMRLDAEFPFHGGVQDVSKRLQALAADPEMHLALEEAELDWAAI